MRYLLFLLLIATGVSAHSQKFTVKEDACEPTTNKKAVAVYKKALKENNPGEQRQLMNEAIGIEPNYYEALFFLGSKYFKTKKFDLAKDKLESVKDICPEYSPYTYYMLGLISVEDGEYKKAIGYMEKFLTYEDIDDKAYDTVKAVLPEIKYFEQLLSNPVVFNPVPMKNVDTPNDEYLGSISPDNRNFFFIRKVDGQRSLDRATGDVSYVEYFMQSTNKGGVFDAGTPLPPPFNSKYNNGAAAITADNKHMYFVICQNQQKEYCDIWQTDFVNGQWTPFKSLGSPINSMEWESQPTISYDGKTMIFASNRAGGFGETDLYMSTKGADGTWSLPVNLGPNINTSNFELTPFLHSDSETLYFSSKGHKGAGGYDIFFSKKDEKGVWGKPKNIGFPINTGSDEVSFFVSLDGKTAYYSSGQLKGPGGLDIFTFELYKEARPEEVLYVEGSVLNNTDKPVTEVEIKNTRTKEVTTVDVDAEDGKYVAVVNAKDDYLLTLKAEGIAFTSKMVSKENTPVGTPTESSLTAAEIKVGESYRLNDINFATNSYELSNKARLIIDEFADFLKKNPTIRVAINGHTDNVGDDNQNLILSDNRAKAVEAYLVSLGVEASRLSAKGYGETKPVASNNSESGRSQNRRTEFVIVSK